MKYNVKSGVVALSVAALAVAGSTTYASADASRMAAMAMAPALSTLEIDFSEETVGFKPNGYSTADAPEVFFSSTHGDLSVDDFAEGNGRSIAAFSGGSSNGGIEIRTSTPTASISVAFGNDDPGIAPVGSRAVMTLFRNGTEVAETSVLMNRNDEADQVLTQVKGPIFNRAVIVYVDGADSPTTLAEVVDDIRVGPLCTIWGTESRNILNGTGGADVLCGAGGNDSIDARGGNDLVFAGPGADTVDAGRGLDTVIGGLGRDILLGRAGADHLTGAEGRDRLNGGAGTDRCNGGPDRDTAEDCENRISIP
jgi:Ca2+-binding RTX toxin-like protein